MGVLPEEEELRIDDLVKTLEARGFDLELFGVTHDELRSRLAKRIAERRGKLERAPISPQKARQEARRRLDRAADDLRRRRRIHPGVHPASRPAVACEHGDDRRVLPA